MVVWLSLLSYWSEVNLPWWLYLWLAVIVWVAYTWDRLIDSYLQPQLVNPEHSLQFSQRHAEHKQHQKLIFCLQSVLAPFVLWGVIILPYQFWSFTPVLGMFCIIYLGITYFDKKCLHNFNFVGSLKHLLASVILIYGLFALINSYTETSLWQPRLLMVAAIATYVFWLNMRCCEYWYHKHKKTNTKYRLGLKIAVLLLLLCFSYFSNHEFMAIKLPFSFILIIMITLSSYLCLLFSPYLWIQKHRLFWADMCLILYPFLILPLTLL